MSANSNGLLFGMIEKETITTLTQNLSDFLMIFSPIIGYLAQGIKFQRTHSSEGFSKYMCLLLIFANLLRIFFWIGKQFTVILLYQSCIVILSQFYLIHMSLKYDTTNPSNLLPITTIISKETEKISKSNFVSLFSFNQTFNKKNFWKWKNEIEYYKFTIIFVLMFSVLCKVIGYNNMYYIDSIGAISTFSESVIALPQIKENFMTHNCKNISFFMVLMWLLGDIFKTGYYIYTLSPMQFIVFGCFQVMLDIILTSQVVYYNSKEGKNEKIKLNKGEEFKKNEEDMRLMNEGDDNDGINEEVGINLDISDKKKEPKEMNEEGEDNNNNNNEKNE